MAPTKMQPPLYGAALVLRASNVRKNIAPATMAPCRVVLAILAIWLSLLPAVAEVPLDRGYPQEAILVTKGNAANLQSLLTANKVVRLEPGQDYASNSNASVGPFSGPLVMTTGMRLYGTGNRVPDITIAAGATDVVISHVVQGKVTFAAGAPDQVTKRCLLRGVHYSEFKTTGGRLVDNLIIDAYNTLVAFDCSSSGFLRNNRMIRHQSQGGQYEILMKGNASDASYGNVLVGTSALTVDFPPGYSAGNPNGDYQARIELDGMRDATLIGGVAESGNGSSVPLMRVLGAEDLKIFQTGSVFSGKNVLDTDTTNIWLHSALLSSDDGSNWTSTNPTLLFRPLVQRLVRSHFNKGHRVSDLATAPALRATLFDNDTSDIEFPPASGTFINNPQNVVINQVARPTTALSDAQGAALLATVSNRTATPWERPSFATPPGPFAGAATNPLTRAQIQAALDTTGVCLLPAGIYDIDQPIKLGWIWTDAVNKKGFYRTLIGAGKSNTILRATSSAIDLIVEGQTPFADNPADSSTLGGFERLVLMELTLQGGRWGIRLEGNDSGTQLGIQYNDNLLSHVCIRDMSAGGLLFTKIYGWDNCCSYSLDFVNCPVGIQQRGVIGDDYSKDIAYMDKCLFYGCQYLNCGIGLDMNTGRASGANTWFNCRFQDCTSRAVMLNHSPVLFANCDFIDNAGRPTVEVAGDAYLISSRFEAQTRDAVDFIEAAILHMEGCSFNRDSGKSVVVTRNISSWSEIPHYGTGDPYTNPYNRASYINRSTYFFNCTVGVPLGQWWNGVAIGTDFRDPADAACRGRAVWSDVNIAGLFASLPVASANVIRSVLVGGQATPRPQLLVGSVLPATMSSDSSAAAPMINGPLPDRTLALNAAMTPISIPTSNGTPTAFDAGPLPPGLSIDRTTGVISGTPTRPGAYLVSVSARNSAGAGVSTLNVLVLGQPVGAPTFGSITPVLGKVGLSQNGGFTASGATSYELDALPPGLTLNASSGLISGTPRQIGSLSATLRATGPGGTSAILVQFEITLQPPAVTLANPVAGSSYLAGSLIALSAQTTPGSGTLTKVEFFTGTTLIGVGTVGPANVYHLDWSSAPAGNLNIVAKVTDSFSQIASSSGTNIAVALNTPPSFVSGGDVYIPRDSGPQTLTAWAKEIRSGISGETAQSVSFLVSVSAGAEFFTSPPVITPDGKLSFTPTPKLSGFAVIKVRLQDNGGTLQGGVDTSAEASFKITLIPPEERVGAYAGLVQSGPLTVPAHENVGAIRVTLGRTGLFSGRLIYGGQTFALQGQIDAFGRALFGRSHLESLLLKRRGIPDANLHFGCELKGGIYVLRGTVETGGQIVSTLEAARCLYSSSQHPLPPYVNVSATRLGTYTILLEPAFSGALLSKPSAKGTVLPRGYAAGRLLSTGSLRLVGKLTDGTPLSFSGPLSNLDTVAFYVSAYGGRGSISGPITVRNTPGLSDFDGLGLLWFKPDAWPRVSSPHGWPLGISLDLLGAAYHLQKDTSVLAPLKLLGSGGNAKLQLAGGTLTGAGLTQTLDLNGADKAQWLLPQAASFQLSISRASGLWSGRFLDAQTHTWVTIRGAIFQKQGLGVGYFLQSTATGGVNLEPSN